MGLSQQRHAIVHVREGHGHSHIPIVHGQHQEQWGSGSERSEIDEEERGTESHLGYGGRGLYCRFGGGKLLPGTEVHVLCSIEELQRECLPYGIHGVLSTRERKSAALDLNIDTDYYGSRTTRLYNANGGSLMQGSAAFFAMSQPSMESEQ